MNDAFAAKNVRRLAKIIAPVRLLRNHVLDQELSSVRTSSLVARNAGSRLAT
jgi:hypothetical protein